jgi:thymidylate synthase
MKKELYNPADISYVNTIQSISKNGDTHMDRTGVGTKRLFGVTYKFDLMETFPIITCKRASFKNTIAELLWFISGSTNVNDLKNIRSQTDAWWRPFANEEGDLGPMYGRQLTNFSGQGINQLYNCVYKLKEAKDSRRILMTTYNPLEADLGALYPCHGLLTQFMVDSNNRLHMSTVQRSADVGLGLPHNWISYACLQVMFCIVCGYVPGVLTYYVNDLHIYNNHLDALYNMKPKSYSSPQLEIKDKNDIFDFEMDDFSLVNYKSGPLIKLTMAV